MITKDKITAISILIHYILKNVYKGENILFSESEHFKLSDESKLKMNNEMNELILSFENANLTTTILDITKGNIYINRLTYYYSVGLKCIEEYKKENDIYSETVLSIMLLSNIIEEKNIGKSDIAPSVIFGLYEKDKIQYSKLVLMIELANLIIEEISKCNYAKMMRNGKKRKKSRTK